VALVLRAAHPPKTRRKTKPSRTSVEKRLRKKQRRSQKKHLRRKLKSSDE
jgi:protein subunit release factor B